jgi:hypothetical protein
MTDVVYKHDKAGLPNHREGLRDVANLLHLMPVIDFPFLYFSGKSEGFRHDQR